jgi:hypothetical protein
VFEAADFGEEMAPALAEQLDRLRERTPGG